MTNKWTTRELLEVAIERIEQAIGESDPTNNMIGSTRFTTTNADGEVCNTVEFKAKALLETAIQLDPTICDDWPLPCLTDDERSHVVYKLQEAEAKWLATRCAKNHDDGVDVIACAIRLPSNYHEMSDSKLRKLQAIVDSDKEFDPTSMEVLFVDGNK